MFRCRLLSSPGRRLLADYTWKEPKDVQKTTEIAKLFHYNPDTNEYFYRHKASLTIAGELIKEDEWVCVTKETFDFLRRSAWAEDKQQDRESRCLKIDGTRCRKDCKNCEHFRSGLPFSLDKLKEDGLLPEIAFDVEEYAEYQDLVMALHQAICGLEERDRDIITMWGRGLS